MVQGHQGGSEVVQVVLSGATCATMCYRLLYNAIQVVDDDG